MRQAAAFGCTNGSRARVVLNAVINFDDTGAYAFHAKSREWSEDYVRGHLTALARCGVLHALRSTADVDADQCFLVSAEWYVPSVGGFSALMRDVRRLLRAYSANTSLSTSPCTLIKHVGGGRSPRPHSPELGSCEHRQAECARKALQHPRWDFSPQFRAGAASTPIWSLHQLRDDFAVPRLRL